VRRTFVRCSENFPESFQRALDILGKRWTVLILFALSEGTARFSELADRLQVVGDRMLSERLKELEAEGLLERRVYAEVPARVEYRLTPKGEALRPVYGVIGRWARDWIEGAAEELQHCPGTGQEQMAREPELRRR
jgi:DNA-binding HxlR family transcriptional regulator